MRDDRARGCPKLFKIAWRHLWTTPNTNSVTKKNSCLWPFKLFIRREICDVIKKNAQRLSFLFVNQRCNLGKIPLFFLQTKISPYPSSLSTHFPLFLCSAVFCPSFWLPALVWKLEEGLLPKFEYLLIALERLSSARRSVVFETNCLLCLVRWKNWFKKKLNFWIAF